MNALVFHTFFAVKKLLHEKKNVMHRRRALYILAKMSAPSGNDITACGAPSKTATRAHHNSNMPNLGAPDYNNPRVLSMTTPALFLYVDFVNPPFETRFGALRGHQSITMWYCPQFMHRLKRTIGTSENMFRSGT